MIKAIQFKNFKALRDTTLPLGRFTLLVGANGTGKSTALEALRLGNAPVGRPALSVGVDPEGDWEIRIQAEWDNGTKSWRSGIRQGVSGVQHRGPGTAPLRPGEGDKLSRTFARARVYSLDARVVGSPTGLEPSAELSPQGGGLAMVLDGLRDGYPERFEALNSEFARWIPEFDRILFDVPGTNQRAIKLRTRAGGYGISATDLSQGTLLALAILTLAYLPDPPPIVGLEEPGRGLHPRLLRDVKDAMYRLAHPESFGEKRRPVQVVATTHSPYMLDLFREHPEEVVIASKVEGNVHFERLADMPNIDEILGDAPLGEVWYSGILGGVPAEK